MVSAWLAANSARLLGGLLRLLNTQENSERSRKNKIIRAADTLLIHYSLLLII